MSVVQTRVALIAGVVMSALVACGSDDRSGTRKQSPSTATEVLASPYLAKVSGWARVERFTGNPEAVAGARLFALSGCLNCHTYNRSGSRNLGAPDLTAEGAKRRGIAFQMKHLNCPGCTSSGSAMPSFAGLGNRRIKKLAVFLEASKNGH
jgi:mono/diheme cytochrome c family protein